MSPEFGATSATFPIDGQTLRYLADTGRPTELIERGRAVHARAGPLPRPETRRRRRTPRRSTSTWPPSSPAWPGRGRPQDRVSLPQVRRSFTDAFGAGSGNGSHLGDGSVVISAITSCTNTSNPALMVGCRPARPEGARPRPRAAAVGEDVASRPGRGSSPATWSGRACSSRSTGSASTWSASAARPASAIPGRCRTRSRARSTGRPEGGRGAVGQPQLRGPHPPGGRATYLASPPLVVAYALAGSVNTDLTADPLGEGADGAGLPARRVAEPRGGRAGADAARSAPTSSTRSTAASSRATSAGRRCPCPRASSSPGIPPRPTCARRPSSSTTPTSRTSSRRVSSRCSATRSRPTTSRPRAPSRRTRRPAATSSRRASRRATSTPTAPRRGNHEVMVRGTFANIRLKNALADARGRLHPPYAVGRVDDDLRRGPALRRRRASRSSSSPAASTAPARRATGRPRARRSWACGRCWRRASSASTARTWSRWA